LSGLSSRRLAAALELLALAFAACTGGCVAEEDTIATILDNGPRNGAGNLSGLSPGSAEAGNASDDSAAPESNTVASPPIADASGQGNGDFGGDDATSDDDAPSLSDGAPGDALSAEDAPSARGARSQGNWGHHRRSSPPGAGPPPRCCRGGR
jgi:hypothetical protein